MKKKTSSHFISHLLILLLLFGFLSSQAQKAETKMMIYKSGGLIFERKTAEIDSVKFEQTNPPTRSVPMEEMIVYYQNIIHFRKDITDIDSVTFFKPVVISPLVVTGTITPSSVPGCFVSDAPAVSTIAALEALPGTLTINQGCSGKDKMTLTSTDIVSGTCPITIIRTYILKDECNNSESISHQITVEDIREPIVKGVLDPITISGCSIDDLPKAVTTVLALEQLQGRITVNDDCSAKDDLIITSKDQETSVCPKIITRTYTITDACNNSFSIGQQFTIEPEDKHIPNAVFIPCGRFEMGSPASEPKWYAEPRDDEQQHQVTLSSFYISKYEVTNSEFAKFLNDKRVGKNALYPQGTFPNKELIFFPQETRFEPWGIQYLGGEWVPYKGYEDHPVVFVTWYGAVEYAKSVGGRLPTEAEWEYACRAGIQKPFNTGDCLTDKQANYDWNYPYDSCPMNGPFVRWHTEAVGSYPPNGWGLYDMHGNISEWCSDWYGPYTTVPQNDPIGSSAGSERVIRGGGNSNVAHACRSAYRYKQIPEYASSTIGFRVAFSCNTSN